MHLPCSTCRASTSPTSKRPVRRKSHAALYIVATSRFNVSPSYILELLNRIFVIVKDFLGIVTEEMVRKNFVLVYEILGKSAVLLQTKSSTSDNRSSPPRN